MPSQPNQTQNQTQTIEITNFGGRLTRKLNGDLNSGLSKFVQSWGYDPFSKPDNLTWLETPVDITSSITDLVVAAKSRYEGGIQYIYAIGNTGKLYKIQPMQSGNPNIPNLDSIVGITSIMANSPLWNNGASMEFFGATEKIYISSDLQINSANLPQDMIADVVVGNANNYKSSFHPLKQFIGKLFFGNGNTIGAIDSTGTVTSSIIGTGQGNLYSELNPSLGVNTTIHDLDLSTDGNYLLITASNIINEPIGIVNHDSLSSASSDGYLSLWNASDATITSTTTIPSYAVTALQTYLSNNYFFSSDALGASLSDGTNKILTLPNNKSPLPNSTIANGNFICWISPELSNDGTGINASMYYFGSLDQENPSGLYRVMRYSSTLTSGFIYQTPLNILTSNKYSSLNTARTAINTFGYGKHYFSVWDLNSSTNSYKFLYFLITPSGSGTPQLGVYETQTQFFGKQITIKQIRVYTEPTVANNGFQIDCIGSDGTVITNGTFTYTFASGTDVTKLQGALERIDFNPAMKGTFALGLRVTNTGTVNMTIKKIEVDWQFSGK